MRGFHIFENKMRDAGYLIDNLDHLINNIEKSLNQTNIHSLQRRALSNELIYNPGKAAEIGFQTLYDLIKKNT